MGSLLKLGGAGSHANQDRMGNLVALHSVKRFQAHLYFGGYRCCYFQYMPLKTPWMLDVMGTPLPPESALKYLIYIGL